MKTPPRQHVLENFIEKYGRAALGRLLDGFEQNVSGPILADELGVSRERIRQWKTLFGASIKVYALHPDILELAKPVQDIDSPEYVEEKILTEDYFVRCREGKELESGGWLLVLPADSGEEWELWIPCGAVPGQAALNRGEEGDRVYRGKWYRLGFRGQRREGELFTADGRIQRLP